MEPQIQIHQEGATLYLHIHNQILRSTEKGKAVLGQVCDSNWGEAVQGTKYRRKVICYTADKAGQHYAREVLDEAELILGVNPTAVVLFSEPYWYLGLHKRVIDSWDARALPVSVVSEPLGPSWGHLQMKYNIKSFFDAAERYRFHKLGNASDEDAKALLSVVNAIFNADR